MVDSHFLQPIILFILASGSLCTPVVPRNRFVVFCMLLKVRVWEKGEQFVYKIFGYFGSFSRDYDVLK